VAAGAEWLPNQAYSGDETHSQSLRSAQARGVTEPGQILQSLAEVERSTSFI
jgi:hypothetical protein